MSFDKGELIRPGVNYNMIRREYGEQLQAVGASPIFLDHSISPEHAAKLCDAIVISGGEDIHPSFYGQEPVHINIHEPYERTGWERLLIDACDRQRIKILGICYGSQLLNIHYGGTLFQDIAKETGSGLDHGKSEKPAVHNVKFKQDFLGFKNGDVVESASRHHQAVKDIAPGFSAVAHADDGIIEAISGYGHYGIQWHSESDTTADNIYGSFVKLVTQTNSVRLAN
jgi:putative glutamine amidotransferase